MRGYMWKTRRRTRDCTVSISQIWRYTLCIGLASDDRHKGEDDEEGTHKISSGREGKGKKEALGFRTFTISLCLTLTARWRPKSKTEHNP